MKEAADKDGQLYGEERLCSLLNSVEKSDTEDICKYVNQKPVQDAVIIQKIISRESAELS